VLSAGEIARRVLTVLAPPPKYTVSEWADTYRRLSSESSAMPGQYRTAVTEYMREPMDMVSNPRVRRITCMFSAQVAKSTFVENVIGYLIHYDPSPILHVSPTLTSMKMFSKERLAPMIRDTPVLRDRVLDAKSRTSENTIESKKFPGGHIAMVGSNAPAGLASRPVRTVLFDEVDRFERSAGTEGDPISLAIKRTTTFWNRIIIMVSTPGNKGASRIEEEYERGDQRRFWVPCPHCDEHQTLKWAQVRWDKSEDGANLPDSAAYVCEHCGTLWTDFERNGAVRRGEWRSSLPFNGNVSYHLNQIYSPFAPLADGVRDFLAALGNPEEMKTWVNTFLGETWEDEGQRLDPHELLQRVEEYETRIPEGVTLLTAGVDVQDDRVEAEIVGWGDNHETWSLEYTRIYGDPSAPDIWQELTRFLKQPFAHPLFGDLTIRAACIDSGGHYTQKVYDYARATERVYAIKGIAGEGRALVGRPTKTNIGKIPLFPVGVYTAKEIVYARLRAKPDEAGYCHFPADRDEEYFHQLTAEKLVTRYHKGFRRLEYVNMRARNEALDNRVYATAALEMLNVDLAAQRRAMIARTRVEEEDPAPQKRKPGRATSSYVNRWRDF
jgi:phage terminase large subunit GpA-like protein